MLTAALVAALACLAWPVRGGGPSGAVATPGGPDPGEGTRPGRGGAAPPDDRDATRSWPARVVTHVRTRLRGGRSGGAWVADFAEVVAVGLEAGLDLPSAALASARSPEVRDRAPWLAVHLHTAALRGEGVTGLLETGAELGSAERRDLALLVGAWRLAEGAGAAAATVTSSAASSVRARRTSDDRTAVVVAGPRASMVLLSGLPLAGPAAALLVGIPPDRLYDTAASKALAVTGVLLTALGWWWARWLLRRASRPGRTDGGST